MAGINKQGRGNTQQITPNMYYNACSDSSFDPSNEENFKSLPIIDLSTNATNNNKITLIATNLVNTEAKDYGYMSPAETVEYTLYKKITVNVPSSNDDFTFYENTLWIKDETKSASLYEECVFENKTADIYKVQASSSSSSGVQITINYTYEPINIATNNVRGIFGPSIKCTFPADSFIHITDQKQPKIDISDQEDNIPIIKY